MYDFFREVKQRGRTIDKEWQDLVARYSQEFPALAEDFRRRVRGELPTDWANSIPRKEDLPTGPTPSRKSAGLVCNPLANDVNNFVVGTADLTPSVNMSWKNKLDFQHVSPLSRFTSVH